MRSLRARVQCKKPAGADHNPADGSNWELLCVYCHDNEHSRLTDSVHGDLGSEAEKNEATHNPFAQLASLLDKKK
jgi:uncharacterized metal-binding protein YceD (DUF177 family)